LLGVVLEGNRERAAFHALWSLLSLRELELGWARGAGSSITVAMVDVDGVQYECD
jgi:hypothetical protein